MTKPLTSADFDNDYAKERQFIEMGAEQKLRPAAYHTHSRELTAQENTAQQLNDIIRENVEASQERINYHE